jgi:hypothetical protein
MNKQQRIVKLVRAAYERAHGDHKRADSERAAAHAGAKAWDKYNDQDGIGGLSLNPYNLNRADEAAIAAGNYLADIREAYEYAVDTFLETPDDAL